VSEPGARVGIVVNPSSGRDIRRLLAQASVFPSGEKVKIVLRALAGMGATGVAEALIMPERAGIAQAILHEAKAERARGHALPAVHILPMPVTDSADDTRRAVGLMLERGVGAIVVLGGDGTHRVVASCCGTTPLLALSTGTNNAFPELHEGTTAGLALGLLLGGRVPPEVALRRNKQLRIVCGERKELALVDLCVTRQPFLGARAVWAPDDLSQLFVAFAEPRAIGLTAILAWAQPVPRDVPWGGQARFGPGGAAVLAPIAPGLIERIPIAEVRRLEPGVAVRVEAAHGTAALDGERELELHADTPLQVTLELDGPRTLEIAATLGYAAGAGLLHFP
jgi:predicted polyphosphate/ATP-dependent NAD kinase